MQWIRLRQGNLLPLLAMFAFLALAHSRMEWSPWRSRFHLAAGLSGLVMLYVLSPRHPHQPTSP